MSIGIHSYYLPGVDLETDPLEPLLFFIQLLELLHFLLEVKAVHVLLQQVSKLLLQQLALPIGRVLCSPRR